ncbi:MAG: DUF547 domain-containing protein [Leptolyngbyaceae cyanobacterium CRU_2_3]|nr:DUF547 domain-containing protein [Leptolyngbyaceae cyanobacterium CRU_2_3]
MDFSRWNTLLHQYVDSQGRVNYLAWKQEQPDAIAQWIDRLEPCYYQRDEQLALWINLYNALTIAAVLENYPIASIQPRIWGFPNWLGFLWFFYRRSHLVFGRRYSLAQIENQILRQQLQEPRIHFAIVCASIGCPLLRNQAYQPESVHQQLEADVGRFINNPDKVRYDSVSGILYCSQIFKWYRQDFLKGTPTIASYIAPYLKQDAALTEATPIAYLPYDWSINQQS